MLFIKRFKCVISQLYIFSCDNKFLPVMVIHEPLSNITICTCKLVDYLSETKVFYIQIRCGHVNLVTNKMGSSLITLHIYKRTCLKPRVNLGSRCIF